MVQGFGIFLVIVLLWPYFVLFSAVKHWDFSFFVQWAPYLLFTFKQAFWSSVISLVGGIFCALGLLSLKEQKKISFFEVVVFLPNFLPILFVIFAFLKISHWFHFSLYGIQGIVFMHSILNMGLVGVFLFHRARVDLTLLSYQAALDGMPWIRFFYHGFLRFFLKDFLYLFLFVFTICWASFSVPLILGGIHGSTMEVLIYQKIKQEGDLAQALSLSLLQMMILWSLYIALSFLKKNLKSEGAFLTPILLPKRLFLIFPLGIVVLLGAAFIEALWSGLNATSFSKEFFLYLLPPLSRSLVVSYGAGFFILCCLLIASMDLKGFLRKFLLAYILPSGALLGVAWIFVFDSPLLGMIWGTGVTGLLFLFRLGGEGLLEKLKDQVRRAQILGATSYQIWRFIILPQVLPFYGLLSGLGAVWALGDFAYSGLVSHTGQETVALIMESLLLTYKWDLANVLIAVLLFLSVMVFLTFRGLGYVVARKLEY